MDLSVLCTIVERLFGLAIMTTRYSRLGSLHGVLLPRTWILGLWEDFFIFKNRTLPPLERLAQATEKLLEDIYTGEYQRHAIRDSDPQNRSKLYWLIINIKLTSSDIFQRRWTSRIKRLTFSELYRQNTYRICVSLAC